jgi:hypothetical protein
MIAFDRVIGLLVEHILKLALINFLRLLLLGLSLKKGLMHAERLCLLIFEELPVPIHRGLHGDN